MTRKLHAGNNPICCNVKHIYNAKIYQRFLDYANNVTVDYAIEWLLKTTTRPEFHHLVRETLRNPGSAK